MGSISGDINSSYLQCANAADLASRPIAALRNGDCAFLDDRIGTIEGPLFFLDRTSTDPVDGVGVLATLGGVGRWLSAAFYNGSKVPVSATTAAALALVPADSFRVGAIAWVDTFHSYFRLDPTSTLPPDGTTVIAASGGGAWLRDVSYQDLMWRSQSTWFISPATGDDENVGDTALVPLASWAEFTRRVSKLAASMTVTILDNITESLVGDFEALSAGLTLEVIGSPTVLASGTIVGVAAPNPAGNAEGTLTASFGAFAAYVGRIVENTSGAASPCQTVVLADVAGTAQTPFWAQLSTYSCPTPAPGDNIRVLQMIEAPSCRISCSPGLDVKVKYLDFVGAESSFLDADTGQYEACEINNIDTSPRGTEFGACAFKATGGVAPRGDSLFVGGASFVTFFPQAFQSTFGFDGFVFFGAGFSLLAYSTGVVIVFTNGLGIFNRASSGLSIGASQVTLLGPLYGDGNGAYGAVVNDGGVLQIAVGLTPTITGASGNLQMDGAANQIPPLVAGAVVPAVSPLTTWAQWAAAPFSRSVLNYTTGSRITGV